MAPGTVSVSLISANLISPRVYRTTTFKMALVYLVFFGISSFALLGFVYWSTAGISTSQTDKIIDAEITGLAEQYRANGMPGVVEIVRERAKNQRQSLYLLVNLARQTLAGNLTTWPDVETEEGGWLEFPYTRPVGGKSVTHQARARHLVLGGGFQLLVGRDVQERLRIERIMQTSLAWAVALTLGLGLIGGLFMSRNLLRRVEVINRTSRDIMAGDLHQRIPVSGSEDELDRLAKNLNDMLEQIERLVVGMRQVTDNIAHDLRSPLNRLRSRLEVTLMSDSSQEDYKLALTQTVEEVEGVLETFNALLNIAKAESGGPDEAFEPVNISRLAEDMAELYDPVAEDKSITLQTEIADGLSILGNAQLLSQALANLLDNGVKYTPAGGAINLLLRPDETGVELIVADSGPGIPADDRDRVLDRFVRLESHRNSLGSGLGLSLVKAVAQRHDARLSLDNNLPGLRVSLRFPLGSGTL